MASDGNRRPSVDDTATSAAGQVRAQPGQEMTHRPDPLEELARIMDQTNPKQPGSKPQAQDSTAHDGENPAFDDGFDDFNALLADEGLVPEEPHDGLIADPYLEDQLSQPGPSTEDFLADLDFGDLDKETQAPSSASPPPLISDYLSPRTAPAQSSGLDDNDLLAAMDTLELEEAQQAVPPLPTATSPADQYSAMDIGAAGASPGQTAIPPLQEEPQVGASPPSQDLAQDMGYGQLSDDYFADLDRDVPPLPSVSEALADEAVQQEKTGGPGRMIVIALAGLAALGVGGVLAFGLLGPGASNDGAPQVIAAAEGDDKVEPVASEETATQPGDAVFETLNETADASTDTPRVVLPGPGSDSSVRSITPTADIAPAPPGSTASRPVRTVTVRADGTVVETAVAPQTPAINTDVTVQAAEARPVETVEVVTDILTPGTVSSDPISNSTETIAAAAQTALQSSTQAVVDQIVVPNITPPQPVARPAIASAQPAPAQQPAVQTQPVQSQTVQNQPVQAQTTQPVQLAAPASAPTTVTPPPAAPAPQQVATAPATVPAATQATGTGDFVVQLASLRSPEQAQATFSTLQGRFGSILTGFTPDIQRADLGERGIYHRLRVGPMDREAANSLCQRYQAAGGDCIVQRR